MTVTLSCTTPAPPSHGSLIQIKLFNPRNFLDWSEFKSIRGSHGQEVGFDESGKWGRGGAAVALIGLIDSIWHVMLFERSVHVDNAGKWGFPGGAQKMLAEGELEPPLHTALEELREEAGTLPRGKMYQDPLVIKESDGVSHHIFILNVAFPALYAPRLNYEHTRCKWFPLTAVPQASQLHLGVGAVIRALKTLITTF